MVNLKTKCDELAALNLKREEELKSLASDSKKLLDEKESLDVEIKKLANDKQALIDQIKSLSGEKESFSGDNAKLSMELKNLSSDSEKLLEANAELSRKNEELNLLLNALESEHKQTKEKLDWMSVRFEKLIDDNVAFKDRIRALNKELAYYKSNDK